MSDSAEGEVSQPETTGTVAPERAREAALIPEDAERFASTFVPVWQLEEAPFTKGAQLSGSELQELGAPTSAAAGLHEPSGGETPQEFHAGPTNAAVTAMIESLRPALAQPVAPETPAPGAPPKKVTASAPPPAQVIVEPLEKVIIAVDPLPSSGGTQRMGAIAIQPASHPEAPPAAVSPSTAGSASSPRIYDDVEFVPKRSNKGILIAVGGGLAVLAILVGLHFTRGGRSSDAATAAPTTVATAPRLPATEESRVPSPPPPAPAPPPLSLSPPPTNTNAANTPSPDTAGAPVSPRNTAPPSPSARPVTPAHEMGNVPAPRSEGAHAPARSPSPPPKSPTKPSGGGIVRDNPF
jgi:hypothetical protein